MVSHSVLLKRRREHAGGTPLIEKRIAFKFCCRLFVEILTNVLVIVDCVTVVNVATRLAASSASVPPDIA